MITSKTPEGGAAGRRSSTPTTITTVEHGSHEEGNDPNIKDKDSDEEKRCTKFLGTVFNDIRIGEEWNPSQSQPRVLNHLNV